MRGNKAILPGACSWIDINEEIKRGAILRQVAGDGNAQRVAVSACKELIEFANVVCKGGEARLRCTQCGGARVSW